MKIGLSIVFLIALHTLAQAAEITSGKRSVLIQGRIENGDQYVLRKVVQSYPRGQIRVVFLNSPGGAVAPIREMARFIRGARLVTVVDARNMVCESACTGLFVAGVRRFYVNADNIEDGRSNHRRGLGFHDASAIGHTGKREYAGAGSVEMINAYYEMGVPGAAQLIGKAGHNDMYYISGATALKLGIATDTKPPQPKSARRAVSTRGAE